MPRGELQHPGNGPGGESWDVWHKEPWPGTQRKHFGKHGDVSIKAMDYIGFGLSDQASFDRVEYHHTSNLKQLVKHLDVQDIALTKNRGHFVQEH